MPASESRKYYLVGTRPSYDGVEPDIDGLDGWTARYLSDDVAVVRDPYGTKDFPPFSLDAAIPGDLPLALSLDLIQSEADALCDAYGLERVDLSQFSRDRVGGM